jgi:hypothetical protein
MSISGGLGVYSDLISGAAKREHTPIRESFAIARKALYSQNNLDKGLDHIKKAAKLTGKDLKKSAKKGVKEAEDAIKKLEEDLRKLVQDEVLIMHFILHSLKLMIEEDKKIESQVPTVESYRKVAESELMALSRVLEQLQNPSVYLRKAGHRKHFFVRDLFSKEHKLLGHIAKFDKGLEKFHKGLKEHSLQSVKEGQSEVEKAIKDHIYNDLKDIFQDTVSFMNVFLQEVKEVISAEKNLEGKYDIIKDEQWVKNTVVKITAEAKQDIGVLEALPMAA